MSHVDNFIILLPTSCEEDIFEKSSFEFALREEQKNAGFAKVDRHAGGYKVFEGDVWMFASNYFGLERMAKLLVTHRVSDYDGLQLLHQAQEEDQFTMYNWDQLEHIANPGDDSE